MRNFSAAECGKAIRGTLRNVPHLIFRKLPLDNFPQSAFRKIPAPEQQTSGQHDIWGYDGWLWQSVMAEGTYSPWVALRRKWHFSMVSTHPVDFTHLLDFFTHLLDFVYFNLNEAIHRASPVQPCAKIYVHRLYTAIRLYLCIVKCSIIGTGLVYTVTHSIDGAT